MLAGPYATMLLADLGADVVKIERAGVGDDTRQWGPPWVGDESTYFQSVNRNKRSFAWDLRDPADLEQARELAARADVVVENFLPGTMDRLGLGYDAVREINPDVVYCSDHRVRRRSNNLPGYDLLDPGRRRVDEHHRPRTRAFRRRSGWPSSTSSPDCTPRSGSWRRCVTVTAAGRGSGSR